jgi:sugar O-acyltransferase (sialic acid O-acetyltransferase NeuD family)
MSLPHIILGAGGHAKVLIEALQRSAIPILGITDSDGCKIGSSLLGIPVIGTDEMLREHAPDSILLVNGLGSVRTVVNRMLLYEKFKAMGYRFASVIHPSAVIAGDVDLAEGIHVMARAVLQPGCTVGVNTIINTGVVLDHDCRIGRHVHLAPGAILSGGVQVGHNTHVGTGAVIIEGRRIGDSVLIAAGAVVVGDIPSGAKAMGIPARVISS